MFNYQLVLKLNDDERIIFAGVTTQDPLDLVHSCLAKITVDSALTIENFNYVPKNFCEDGTKEKTS